MASEIELGMKLKPQIITLGAKIPFCPLCHQRFDRKYDPKRNLMVYLCHTDRIGIRVDDPFVNRWDEALARSEGGRMECPNCNANMRYFATSTGYAKMVCPKKKCRMALELGEPDRDKKKDLYSVEDKGVLQ